MQKMQYEKGEYYDHVEIVTEAEAWDMFFSSDEYAAAEKRECENLRSSYMRDGISAIEGFFLRSDGRVELDR